MAIQPKQVSRENDPVMNTNETANMFTFKDFIF